MNKSITTIFYIASIIYVSYIMYNQRKIIKEQQITIEEQHNQFVELHGYTDQAIDCAIKLQKLNKELIRINSELMMDK